jgi:hypothetical protein
LAATLQRLRRGGKHIPSLAAELVRLKADMLVDGLSPAQTAKQAPEPAGRPAPKADL